MGGSGACDYELGRAGGPVKTVGLPSDTACGALDLQRIFRPRGPARERSPPAKTGPAKRNVQETSRHERCRREGCKGTLIEWRVHSGDPRTDEGIRRLCCGPGCQSQGAPRPHPCADRPERRRQDHLLQPAVEVPAAVARRDPLQRQRHHLAEAGRYRAAWARAVVPDFGSVSASDGAGKRARGSAAPARQLVRFLAFEIGARSLQRSRA